MGQEYSWQVDRLGVLSALRNALEAKAGLANDHSFEQADGTFLPYSGVDFVVRFAGPVPYLDVATDVEYRGGVGEADGTRRRALRFCTDRAGDELALTVVPVVEDLFDEELDSVVSVHTSLRWGSDGDSQHPTWDFDAETVWQIVETWRSGIERIRQEALNHG